MSSKLFLYDHPVSSYAQKVRIGLREKGLPFDSKIPEGLGSGHPIPDLGAANPRLEVPALEDGDFKIFDSKIILSYLEDKFPEHALMPKDAQARAEARMIEEMCDTHYEAVNWGIGEVEWSQRATGELAEKLMAEAKSQTMIIYSWLESKLGKKDFFNGSSFGYADLAVAPYVNRSEFYGLGPAEGTPLQKWFLRVKGVPSVKETYTEMEEGAKKMAAARGSFSKGSGRRREYRDHRLEWMVKSGGLSIVQKGVEEETVRFSWPGGI